MNRIALTVVVASSVIFGAMAAAILLPRSSNSDKRMDVFLGRVFIANGVQYVSARKYPLLADHIVCVGEDGKELILHVAAIENIIQTRQNVRDIIKEISK